MVPDSADMSEPTAAGVRAGPGNVESIAHPRGALVLVLGVLSVTLFPVLGPVAWGIGRATLRQIDAEPADARNRTTVLAGMILGIVGTVLLIIGAVLVVVIIIWATTGDGIKQGGVDTRATFVLVGALVGSGT
jgi:hypothetical protein